MTTWSQAIERFQVIHPHRHPKLFTEFLPQGYELMTLSSVDDKSRHDALRAKCFLGMYITLYDDLADNPALFNQNLLNELYTIPFQPSSAPRTDWTFEEQTYLAFAHFIADALMTVVKTLPGYRYYHHLFEFDVMQFYNANRYYTLAQLYPSLCNSVEARLFGPFNMGMTAAGTIDIMASPKFREDELGQARALFLFGQRYGHICNSQTTLLRELAENTFTNEALLIAQEKSRTTDRAQLVDNVDIGLAILNEEQDLLLKKLATHAQFIHSFDAFRYIEHLKELRRLHERLMGVI